MASEPRRRPVESAQPIPPHDEEQPKVEGRGEKLRETMDMAPTHTAQGARVKEPVSDEARLKILKRVAKDLEGKDSGLVRGKISELERGQVTQETGWKGQVARLEADLEEGKRMGIANSALDETHQKIASITERARPSVIKEQYLPALIQELGLGPRMANLISLDSRFIGELADLNYTPDKPEVARQAINNVIAHYEGTLKKDLSGVSFDESGEPKFETFFGRVGNLFGSKTKKVKEHPAYEAFHAFTNLGRRFFDIQKNKPITPGSTLKKLVTAGAALGAAGMIASDEGSKAPSRLAEPYREARVARVNLADSEDTTKPAARQSAPEKPAATPDLDSSRPANTPEVGVSGQAPQSAGPRASDEETRQEREGVATAASTKPARRKKPQLDLETKAVPAKPAYARGAAEARPQKEFELVPFGDPKKKLPKEAEALRDAVAAGVAKVKDIDLTGERTYKPKVPPKVEQPVKTPIGLLDESDDAVASEDDERPASRTGEKRGQRTQSRSPKETAGLAAAAPVVRELDNRLYAGFGSLSEFDQRKIHRLLKEHIKSVLKDAPADRQEDLAKKISSWLQTDTKLTSPASRLEDLGSKTGSTAFLDQALKITLE